MYAVSLESWMRHPGSLHFQPSVGAIRNALIGGSPWRGGRPYRGASCCDGLMNNHHYFWERWPNFCADFPDTSRYLVDLLLSRGSMYCPDCHGLHYTRALICKAFQIWNNTSSFARGSTQLVDHRDPALTRFRDELGYTSNGRRLHRLTTKSFDECLQVQSAL